MTSCADDNIFFSNKLIDWYNNNKRNLPWRETNDAYKIWLSEIIMQQTRVAQGLAYYLRMTERFCNVQALAEADEEEVLKCWQGLGYYSRAINLHTAAKTVLAKHNGIMPTDYESLIKLKGIGEYTAAAIASFAENAPHPVVDGNVYRFLARYLAITQPINTTKSRKVFTQVAMQLIDKQRPGLFNQAIMEFGALQCTPGIPDCGVCPFLPDCKAKSENKVEAYPVRQGKPKSKNRYFHYFHIVTDGHTFLNKRTQQDIWRNLYEFPMIETTDKVSFEQLQATESFGALFDGSGADRFKIRIEGKRHILSHQVLYVNFYRVETNTMTEEMKRLLRVAEGETDQYPMHRLMVGYFRDIENGIL